MNIEKTKLDGVMKITLSVFTDYRGQYKEIYNEKEYDQFGVHFVADDVSVSRQNVLRGIHGDGESWKLVSCLYGAIQLVVVDCLASRNFGEWESFLLAEDSQIQILIPPNYGNAHLVLSQYAVFHYKQSEYYHSERQFTYRYDDSRFGIKWLSGNPTLSERDRMRIGDLK